MSVMRPGEDEGVIFPALNGAAATGATGLKTLTRRWFLDLQHQAEFQASVSRRFRLP